MLNKIYTSSAIAQAKKVFEQDGYLTLQQFFSDEYCDKLSHKVRDIFFDYSQDILTHAYEHKQITLELPQDCLQALFTLSGSQKLSHLEAFALSHQQYKMLTDQDQEQDGTFILIELGKWDDAWGGTVVFQTLESIETSALANSVTLIRGPLRYFFKYVNHYARGKHMFVLGKL